MRSSLLIVPILLTSCAAGRIDDLEKLTAQQKRDIQDIRALQAEHTAALTDLRAEISSLTGRIEELTYSAKGKTEQLERTLQAVQSRVPPPAGVPEDLLAEDEAQISRVSGPAAELFKMGLQQMRTGDFESSRASFERFVSENPSTAFTDNALFWLGVAGDKLGQYDRAVVSYSDVFRKFPAEDRVAPALYRLAEDFLKMNSRSEATITLQKLVEEHPSSEYGRKGRALLAEISPPAGKKKKK